MTSDANESRPAPTDVRRDGASAPQITVAVISWNTKELLDRCLTSLEPLHRAGLADVWVVDNASEDGSAALVSERHSWVHLIVSEVNLGYGAAVHLVTAATSGPWLALANADIAVRPGALEALVRAGRDDQAAGILAPRLVLPDGTTQHSVWAFPTVGATIMQNVGPHLTPARLADRLALSGAWNPARARRVPWAEGA
ncbi:MAG: glycosyltransferase, partial [Solirubrobacteraceae bacterium]